MLDSYTFAADVVRTISERLLMKSAEISQFVDAGVAFEDWLVAEAFLGCLHRQRDYPFSEVMHRPTYASENVAASGLTRLTGDLRVGGPDDGANHCWAFIEFCLVDEASRDLPGTSERLANAADRLLRLGWKKSAALLTVVATSANDGQHLSAPLLNQPTVTPPHQTLMPNGSTLIIKAFDIKREPTDILQHF